ncbi:MAG: hypothetical protein JSR17_07450 [Proteobacteria bacterium]|nr:hypothetical protein [Pseudomonadota bacterium]
MPKIPKTLDVTDVTKDVIQNAIEKALTSNRLNKSSAKKQPISFKDKKNKHDQKTPQ